MPEQVDNVSPALNNENIIAAVNARAGRKPVLAVLLYLHHAHGKHDLVSHLLGVRHGILHKIFQQVFGALDNVSALAHPDILNLGNGYLGVAWPYALYDL